MFLNLGLPMGTIMFLSISLIMYLVKKKYHDFQNKLFIFLLIFTYVLLFLEIAYVITMANMDKIPIINECVCRLFLTGIIVWVITFFFYILSISMNTLPKENLEKYTKLTKYTIVLLGTALAITDCFFKVEYVTDVGLYAIVGPATYFVYGVVGVLMIILFFIVLKFKSVYSKSLRIPFFFTLFLIAMDTIHLFLFEINDLTLILALIVSSLFFTIESQDRMLLKEVEEAKNRSEEVNKAKTNFLSNMSHEIRTPMNTILGFSNSLLIDENLTREKVLEDSKSIHQASVNLLDLINNILDISRIESGKEAINEKDYKLSDLISEINNILKSKLSEKESWYDLEVNKKMPSVYYGDYAKVLKIVSATVINAIKYSDNGYINVAIDYEEKEDKTYLKFLISNSKSKMPEEYYNQDFSDFSKLDYGKENKLDSEFLGLVIAKRLITMMDDSTISFKRENDTTKCSIELCQKIVNKAEIGDNYINESTVKVIDCTGKKALVVDDNEINLKLAERLLKSYNFNVTKASGGNECINLVKANDYDIIFLDHMMPDLDGIKTLHILRNIDKKMPRVIAMTANTNSDSKDFYEKEGFDAYLGKPINKTKLDSLIDSLFGGNV